MTDDEAENFALCLLRDIYGAFVAARGLKITIPPELEEERCVPKTFYSEIIELCKPLINVLLADIVRLPVLLYLSEEFFEGFTSSVCLKLNKVDEDEQVSFLKVTAFIVIISATLFVNDCYRPIDALYKSYQKMLKDHLTIKFVAKGKFREIIQECKKVRDDEKWKANTVDEMKKLIKESCKEELARTKLYANSVEEEACKNRILDLRNRPNPDSGILNCKYCGIQCMVLLQAFFQQKIKYKS